MSSVSFQPIFEQVLNPLIQDAATVVVATAIGWITYEVHQHAPPFIKGYLEKKAAADLNTALQNGVAIMMHKLEGWESVHADVQVRGAILAGAAQYAINHVPDAIARFGLDLDALEMKALAYIPPPPPSDIGTTGESVKTIPVDVMPLAKL